MANPNFAQNLRSISKQKKSVAAICRAIEINRQQFNKYLSGQIYPSKFNLQRICRYFKLTDEQFALPMHEFNELTAQVSNQSEQNGSRIIENAIDSLPNSIESLARYEGYYHSHFHALGFPGYLVRSLIQIRRIRNRFYTGNIEHLWDKKNPNARQHRFKYHGIAFYLSDRIFITEYELLAKNSICHTILLPSYRNTIDLISGISTGVGSLNTHLPKATRAVFKYLGKDIAVREALHDCGLFELECDDIDAEIKLAVDNEILANEYMLAGRDL